MDYEYEDPAAEGGDGMDVEESDNNNAMDEEAEEEEEDIPVTQEDAWAVIRCVACGKSGINYLYGIWDSTSSTSCVCDLTLLLIDLHSTRI